MRVLIFLFFANCFAQNAYDAEINSASGNGLHSEQYPEKEEEGFDVVGAIMEHIADSHEWHLFGSGEESVSIPLPVILYTEKGLVSFLSSSFFHDDTGSVIVERKGLSFVRYHGKIYQLEDEASRLSFSGDDHHPANIRPLDFSITKNVLSIFISALIMLVVFSRVCKSYKKSVLPNGSTNGVIDALVCFIRNDIARPIIGEKKYEKYMPYLLTLFFFIWINNLLGLIPSGANVTGNISVTLALALFTMLVVLFSGNKNYWAHIFWMPGVPKPIRIILAPIELAGVFIKPFALMIRLFANITAGHIIILGLISIIFIFGWSGTPSLLLAICLLALELVVAFIQAYIFTFLTSLFIGSAVKEGH